jgi:hypothetical protein
MRERKMTNAYRILVGKSERKRSLGKPRRRWEDNGSKGNRAGTCGLDASGSG